jgi:two-component system response regulator
VRHPAEILLVEDSPGDVLLTKEAFERGRLANTLHVVDRGEDALAFLYRVGAHVDAPRPDLILLDVNLPGISGLDVLERIKSDEDLCSIPVVVLTTSSADEDVLSAYRHHANAYVRKPVEFPQFLATVREVGDFWLTIVTLPPAVERC